MRKPDVGEPLPNNESGVRHNGDGSSRTRRAVLKRGAAVGAGTIVWVTPVVQQLAMSEAAAQTVSPGGGPPSVGGDTAATTVPATNTAATTVPATNTATTTVPATNTTINPVQRPNVEQVGDRSVASTEAAGPARNRDGGASRTLPVTGADLVGLGAAGLGAVAAGKTLRRTADRRRATPTPPPQDDDA